MQSESRTSPGPSQQGNMSAERDQPQMRGGELQTGEAQGQDGPSTEAQSDAPAARFTAVNNKEPLSNATPNNSGVNNEMRRPSQPEYPPRITPPGQEKLTITTTNTDRENWADTVNGPRNGSHNVPPPPSFSEGSNPHKRKRSGSFGGERESDQSNSAGSYHKHSLPAIKANSDLKGSPDTPYPDSAASKINPESATRDPYATPQTPYGQYGGDGRENASWYTQNSAVSEHHLSAEQRLHEALQRDSNNNSDGQANFSETSPAQDDRSGAAYQGQYGQVQQDHKKRKRNFSNRTKTGCMTCRKRKKKCDESRPECELSQFDLRFVYVSGADMLQATTASVVGSCATATQVAANGQSQTRSKAPSHFRPRMATTRLQVKHHNNITLTLSLLHRHSQSVNHCHQDHLTVASNCVLIHYSRRLDHLATTIVPAQLLLRVHPWVARIREVFLPRHTLQPIRSRHQSVPSANKVLTQIVSAKWITDVCHHCSSQGATISTRLRHRNLRTPPCRRSVSCTQPTPTAHIHILHSRPQHKTPHASPSPTQPPTAVNARKKRRCFKARSSSHSTAS